MTTPISATFQHTAPNPKVQDPAHPFSEIIGKLVEVTTATQSFVGELVRFDEGHGIVVLKQFVAPFHALIPLAGIVAVTPARVDDDLWGLIGDEGGQ